MKKNILVLCMTAGLLAQSALATITFSTNQATYNGTPGSTVAVTLQVTTTGASPATLDGFDTIFEAAPTQNGASIDTNFSISASTPGQAGWISSGASYPAAFAIANSDHTGFTQTLRDNGYFDFSGSPVALPGSAINLAIYTFSILAGTPAGNYVFETTPGSYTNSAGGASTRYSRISDSTGGPAFRIDNLASFTISIGAVPEPATLSLLGLGALGTLGLTVLRARRKS